MPKNIFLASQFYQHFKRSLGSIFIQAGFELFHNKERGS